MPSAQEIKTSVYWVFSWPVVFIETALDTVRVSHLEWLTKCEWNTIHVLSLAWIKTSFFWHIYSISVPYNHHAFSLQWMFLYILILCIDTRCLCEA